MEKKSKKSKLIFKKSKKIQKNENLKIANNGRKKNWKPWKIIFEKIKKKFSFNFFWPEEKHTILLVLPIEEICLWPELSSPDHFRIQGGGGPLNVTQEQ